jgi:hypothetical protein
VKTIATASALVALVALGSLSMGCSASSSTGTKGGGQGVSTGTALSALKSPTGSFTKATASSAFAGYRSQRESSKHVSAPVPNGGGAGGGTAGTASIRTVRLLDQASTSGACASGQDCACPTGGTMAYESEQTSEGQLVSVHFDACGFEDGMKFDGEAVLLASTKSLLGAAADAPSTPEPAPAGNGSGLKEASNPSDATSGEIVSLLLAASGTASQGGQSEVLEFALLTEASYAFLAVKVADGTVVIGVREDGSAVVHAKDATYQCKSGSQGYVCTSETGETIEAAADDSTASNDGSPSGAPSGSPAPSDGSGN